MDKTRQLLDIMVEQVVADFARDYIKDIYDKICSMFVDLYDVENMESDEIVSYLSRTYEDFLGNVVYAIVSDNRAEIVDSYFHKVIHEVCDIPSVAQNVIEFNTSIKFNDGYLSPSEMVAKNSSMSRLASWILKDEVLSIGIYEDLYNYIIENFDVVKELCKYFD